MLLPRAIEPTIYENAPRAIPLPATRRPRRHPTRRFRPSSIPAGSRHEPSPSPRGFGRLLGSTVYTSPQREGGARAAAAAPSPALTGERCEHSVVIPFLASLARPAKDLELVTKGH